MEKKKKLNIARLIFYPIFFALICATYIYRYNIIQYHKTGNFKRETVNSILEKYDSRIRIKFESFYNSKNVKWPPEKIYLLAFKREKIIEVWGSNKNGPYYHLVSYPLTGSNGKLGTKKREGDRQIPEGIYQLTGLNPNSSFHLSIKIGYPNQEDIKNSRLSKKEMGGDIFIHGSSVSTGCLPIGDSNIEELFCLVAHANSSNRKILIAPVNFRKYPGFVLESELNWVNFLYRKMEKKLRDFKLLEEDPNTRLHPDRE